MEEPKSVARIIRDYFEKKWEHEHEKGNLDVSKNIKHGVYSEVSPCLNEINDQRMFKIKIEQVDLKLMKYATY